MRTCQSCGLQNPPDRDFCECGEYLRWEPTGYVQAITPEMAAQAAAEAAAPAQEPIEAPASSFIVYCDKPVAEEVQAGIARCIEQHKPVGTAYRLRVKAPKKKDTS